MTNSAFMKRINIPHGDSLKQQFSGEKTGNTITCFPA